MYITIHKNTNTLNTYLRFPPILTHKNSTQKKNSKKIYQKKLGPKKTAWSKFGIRTRAFPGPVNVEDTRPPRYFRGEASYAQKREAYLGWEAEYTFFGHRPGAKKYSNLIGVAIANGKLIVLQRGMAFLYIIRLLPRCCPCM